MRMTAVMKKINTAISASRDARPLHIVIVHPVCLYWDYSINSANLVNGCSQHCILNRVAVDVEVADSQANLERVHALDGEDGRRDPPLMRYRFAFQVRMLDMTRQGLWPYADSVE